MSIRTPEKDAVRLRDFDRAMLKSAFSSLFGFAIKERKRAGKFTLQSLADALGTDKSVVSRWFTRDAPNWTLNSVSDLANALDLDIRIEATDRKTGTVFTPAGPAAAKRVHPPRTETASHRVERPSEAPTTKAD